MQGHLAGLTPVDNGVLLPSGQNKENGFVYSLTVDAASGYVYVKRECGMSLYRKNV